uniref:Putative secreted protein n=1 Tax=Anopheles darlingi TaxID=43151 RepID=A0A2M4D328_ANODA
MVLLVTVCVAIALGAQNSCMRVPPVTSLSLYSVPVNVILSKKNATENNRRRVQKRHRHSHSFIGAFCGCHWPVAVTAYETSSHRGG